MSAHSMNDRDGLSYTFVKAAKMEHLDIYDVSFNPLHGEIEQIVITVNVTDDLLLEMAKTIFAKT